MRYNKLGGGNIIVFVSSPYRGDIETNKAFAIAACKAEIAAGNIPYAPHLFFPLMITDDEQGIVYGFEMLKRCDELHYYGEISEGMGYEITYARANEIPVLRCSL